MIQGITGFIDLTSMTHEEGVYTSPNENLYVQCAISSLMIVKDLYGGFIRYLPCSISYRNKVFYLRGSGIVLDEGGTLKRNETVLRITEEEPNIAYRTVINSDDPAPGPGPEPDPEPDPGDDDMANFVIIDFDTATHPSDSGQTQTGDWNFSESVVAKLEDKKVALVHFTNTADGEMMIPCTVTKYNTGYDLVGLASWTSSYCFALTMTVLLTTPTRITVSRKRITWSGAN